MWQNRSWASCTLPKNAWGILERLKTSKAPKRWNSNSSMWLAREFLRIRDLNRAQSTPSKCGTLSTLSAQRWSNLRLQAVFCGVLWLSPRSLRVSMERVGLNGQDSLPPKLASIKCTPRLAVLHMQLQVSGIEKQRILFFWKMSETTLPRLFC